MNALSKHITHVIKRQIGEPMTDVEKTIENEGA